MATTEDLAYAAGIIDGEGCISLHKVNDTKDKLRCSYALHLVVAMSDMVVPTWLHINFGGSLQHYKGRTKNRKGIYIWTVAAEKARIFLTNILPYLRLKKPQAEIAIEFQTTKHSNWHKWNQYNVKPTALTEAEAILSQKVQALNGGKPWQRSF